MTSETVEVLFERYGPAYRWLVTVTAMTGMVSMVLSMTSINVAVPDVMGAFGIGQDKAQWMSTAYLATMTTGMLLSSWLIAILGERVVFLSTLVLFSVGAVLGGFAPTIDFVIFARVMQGLAAGITQPLVMATLFSVFPPERRGSAMGVLGLGIVFAPAIGPTLGGIAIDMFSWRYVFFISLPLCAVAMVLGAVFMPTRRLPDRIPGFDWAGFGFLCVALLCLLTALADGQREGWTSDYIVLLLVVGTTAAAGFILRELFAKAPLLDLTIFADPAFASAATIGFIFGAGLLGSTYIIPVFVQTIQGYTPLRSGLLLMPAGLLLAFIFPLAGRVSDTMPSYILITGGLVVFALAFFLMGLADVNTGFWTFAFFTALTRLGLGFVNPVLNASALKAVPPEKVRQGAGAVTFIRQLGGAFGVSLLVAFLEQRTRFHGEAFTATQTVAHGPSRDLVAAIGHLFGEIGLPAAEQDRMALSYLGQMLYAQARTLAFQDTFMVIGVVAVVALVPAWAMSRSHRRKSAAAAVEDAPPAAPPSRQAAE